MLLLEKIKSPIYTTDDNVEVYINRFGREVYRDIFGRIVNDQVVFLLQRGFVRLHNNFNTGLNHLIEPNPGDLYINTNTGELAIFIGTEFVLVAG